MSSNITLTDRTIVQIPARAGSQRVSRKNLRLMVGRPLIEYSIRAALDAGCCDEVIVNSDSDQILEFASSMGAGTYQRPASLAGDEATGDDFTYDFIQRFKPKTLVLVNPACPLIESSDIVDAISAFKESTCDTLITCSGTRMPTFCNGNPVNIDLDGPMAPTQNNPKVVTLNWAIAVWDVRKYIQNYEELGHAYMGVDRAYHEIDPWKAVKISVESDFKFAELLLAARQISAIGSSLKTYWSS